MPSKKLPFSCSRASTTSRAVPYLMRGGHARALLDMVLGIDEAVVQKHTVDADIEEIEGKSSMLILELGE
ncbi:hypothetical protein DSECCO2_636940 [anaerobic digester metagenome]